MVGLVALVCLVFDHCVRLDPKSFEVRGSIFTEAAGLWVCLMWHCNQTELEKGRATTQPPGCMSPQSYGQLHRETEGIIAIGNFPGGRLFIFQTFGLQDLLLQQLTKRQNNSCICEEEIDEGRKCFHLSL